MNSLENRIRSKANLKALVTICRKKRSALGFAVLEPDGRESFYSTRREALQALFARVRCAPVRRWSLIARRTT